MIKEKSEKDEAKNKILKILEKTKTVSEIVRAGVKEKTVYYHLNRKNPESLLNQGKIIETLGKDKNGRPIRKFQSIRSKNIVNPDYLKFIKDNYKSGVKERVQDARSELRNIAIGSNKEILDKEFIDFIIDEHKKLIIDKNSEPALTKDIELALWHIITQLIEDIDLYPEDSTKQDKLLNYIKGKIENFYKQVILNNSMDICKRYDAYEIMDSMDYPEISTITLELLKNIKYQEGKEDDFYSIDTLFSKILQNVKIYFENNPLNCKKSLWEIYDKHKDKRIKDRILFMIHMLLIGKEHHVRDIRRKYIYNFVKPKIKE